MIGAGLLAVGSRYYHHLVDRKKAAALREIRRLFEAIGPIATVYIDEQTATRDRLRGGVVMEDGTVFAFVYQSGQIDYWEESR